MNLSLKKNFKGEYFLGIISLDLNLKSCIVDEFVNVDENVQ